MKLAIVTNAFTFNRVRLFERLAKENNHKITIFKYADWWDAESDYLEVKKWQSVGFKIPFLIDDIYFHFDYRVLLALTQAKWDVIIAYGYGSLTTWLVALVAKFLNIPFILWSDARLEYELTRSPITRWLKILLHRLSTHFIASSTSAQLFFQHMGIRNTNITLAPYAIDNELFYKNYIRWKCQAEVTRNDLKISNESLVILYVGRLVEEKGINELIISFSHVHKMSKITLVLVGDGKDRSAFESMAGKMELTDIIFTGPVPPDKVAKYYAIGDIFVLPSYKDVWGLVVNEAMVCGLPIVTTREVGAWRDLVQHDKNGFVIDSRDVETLTKVLMILCKEHGIRRVMGQYSRHIIHQWDIQHALENVEFVLKKYKKEYLSSF